MCHSIAILILVCFYFVVSAGPGAEGYVEKGFPDFEYLSWSGHRSFSLT